jgi:hypothetical protein
MIFLITRLGFMTPIEDIPTPDFAVPYAAPMLAKTRAHVTPMYPKNGATGGHVSISTLMMDDDNGYESRVLQVVGYENCCS